VRQRELLLRQVQLQRVTERDLERIVLPPRPAFEKELALFADDEELRRLARPAWEVDDRVDDPDVEVRHHDRKLFGGKRLPRPAPAALRAAGPNGPGRGRRLNGGRDGLHGGEV
jgi:hypothetical protein